MKGLTLWSFLMATAHGAGLMVVPVFVGMSMTSESGHVHHMGGTESGIGTALLATSLHAAGYLAVTALIAVLCSRSSAWGYCAAPGSTSM